MKTLGRAMQLGGLVVLPLGVALQLMGLSLRHMLLLMVAGVALFYLGRMFEGLGAG